MATASINGERLWASLMDLARIGATPKGGVRRITLTDTDREGRDQFVRWAREAQLDVRWDAIGNIFARRAGTDPAAGPVLEAAPGLIVTQHSGEGKANQYFLRGFALDHGTDFAVNVDGMPVNLPSHAHAQGYADLNFLMPELVDHIHYRKGPYYADQGDFSAAGAAHLHLRRSLPAGLAQLSVGSYGYRRGLFGANRDLGGANPRDRRIEVIEGLLVDA